MKKKLLPLAMLAGLAGAAGTAQAVHINSDGTGSALIFPYYSADGGNYTTINLTNTSSEAKAVKVRFIEGVNSREVLDFNLYMSPYDHWSVAVQANGEGAGLVLPSDADGNYAGDTTCTVPNFAAFHELSSDGSSDPIFVPFRDLEYTGGSTSGADADDGPQTLDRVRQGYVEVIEMGVLDTDWADAADHTDVGIPTDCDALSAAWLVAGIDGTGIEDGIEGTGEWAQVDANGNPLPAADEGDPSDGVFAATGGIYGYGSVVNANAGTTATYSAVALDDFDGDAPNHTEPGSVEPTLAAATDVAQVFGGTRIYDFDTTAGDAVSVALMRDTLSNDYVLDEDRYSATDWVITFPTKRFYVETGTAAEQAPFTSEFGWTDEAQGACEPINVRYWDREEQETIPEDPTSGLDFSPRPSVETSEPVGFNLCKEVNVIGFWDASETDLDDVETLDDTTYRPAIGGHEDGYLFEALPVIFDAGWATIDLTVDAFGVDVASPGRELAVNELTDGPTVINGLPVVGFALQTFINASVTVEHEGEEYDVAQAYSGLVEHKYTRSVGSD
ncbi:hypothetical protein [Gilvimarinus sp. 1_MG-2023]|uniref:hypothetical protein n=1 Tax=Gilvimarinus sp. 1_MG-2023 TaxID=3062638 RepID=UPI0026E17CD1|nr:hypothetical protein [Gilvimarinus sp. 1_MG-2023]MDO6746800.1 hypothetical protein [Gilvimarinus sp. 1_MG-2023]